ncbi:hypothetical protein SHIRM173S_04480 [Streptomyces hirsutus]
MTGSRTHIATSDATSITVRGKDLCEDLVTACTASTDMIYFLSVGRMPTPPEARVLDACLVTLMEHGWTPTSIITRLAADSVPDDVQVAIAAGLLSVGWCSPGPWRAAPTCWWRVSRAARTRTPTASAWQRST